ncbi:WD40 repeat-like protein [Athelia psychrophila]|uniref:WD40 repeat-like protein n=1 Tax=Athelia psychrophila TaxID=1759441 RepID=A0A166TQH4_9AGAM|nr:WD40 repeat-like protein [Fibularhizoctonia sp. CBS 109695]
MPKVDKLTSKARSQTPYASAQNRTGSSLVSSSTVATSSAMHIPASVSFSMTGNMSGNSTINNIVGDQHNVYEINNAPAALHALDLLKMLDPAVMDGTFRPQCLDGTRRNILHCLIHGLTAPSPETNVFWLHGLAGSGKSTIATTIAEQLRGRAELELGAFLFFDRNSPSQSGPNGVIRTLAFQLALSNNILRDAICDAIERDPQVTTRPLNSQFNDLVLTPLRSCSSRITGPVICVLDAFDECGDAQSRRTLVRLLAEHLPLLPQHFRFLVTSRPEPDLRSTLGSHPRVKSFSLNATEWSSASDVLLFFQHEMNVLYLHRRDDDELPYGWPGSPIIQRLGGHAGDSFIWAATAIRYLYAADDVEECLHRLLNQNAFSLGDLYSTALRTASNWEPTETSTQNFLRILGAIVVGRVPLTDDAIVEILGLEQAKSCRLVLRKLACLLHWSEGLPIRTLHASFADYLTDARRCGDQPWFIDQRKHHTNFAIGCLHAMKRLLRFNICRLETSYLKNSDVPDLSQRVQKCVPRGLAYACRFWAEHLNHGDMINDIPPLILKFFQNLLLYWLEVLSLIREGRAAFQAMLSVEVYCKWHHLSEIRVFAKDGISFLRAFASIISESAPHIYISAIAFAPSASILKLQYSSIIKNTLRVETGAKKNWPACEQVIEAHTSIVTSVAFSPNGDRIASGSQDKTIRIWDARTGKLVAGPFEGHTGLVISVTFSPGGERVASGSGDKTIRIWDAHTGELIAGPFTGHEDDVTSVAFSPDGERVVSGSLDKTVRIWDACTGELVAGPFDEHADDVTSVAFSPSGERVASGSCDNTIRIWDARTGELIKGPLEGHTGFVTSVAFSPDGERIASGSDDKTIRMWDGCTGELVAGPFEGHTSFVTSVAFSPNGERVASGSLDKTIRIWDARTGALVAGPFGGHADNVTAVAFSPDGERVASGSLDATIRIWDARADELVAGPFDEHADDVTSVAFSPDGEGVASSGDKNIRIWDARTGKLVAGPFDGHAADVTSVAFSPDGERVASGSDDKTIRIWDVHTGGLVAGPFEGHTSFIASVAFSPGGNRVASGSGDRTIRIWDARTGELVVGPLGGHTRIINSLAFSPDGDRIASGSWDKTICIWDTRTGALIAGPFDGHADIVSSVAFSPDGERVASGSCDKTIRMWDGCTGELVAGPFEGHTSIVTSVAFSPGGDRVASGSQDKTIRIWDVCTGELIAGPFEGHTNFVTSVAFSPDGERVASGSLDKTIRIWDCQLDNLFAGPFGGQGHNTFSTPLLSDGERVMLKSKIDITSTISHASSRARQDFTSSSRLENGWMVNSTVELLFWVPPAYRLGLWRPNNTLVIGPEHPRLDLTHFVHGDDWARCHV